MKLWALLDFKENDAVNPWGTGLWGLESHRTGRSNHVDGEVSSSSESKDTNTTCMDLSSSSLTQIIDKAIKHATIKVIASRCIYDCFRNDSFLHF
mmetsp:Transcript_7180/g.10933  ORF Transcript_7180/g.10933 Transcript_7180/m.10933 type:complete len:95 (-) Transcript_7180:341-625(-)